MKRYEWKQIVADYFSFSVRERWAVLVLLLLIIILFVLPEYLPEPKEQLVVADSLVQAAIRSWDTLDQRNAGATKYVSSPNRLPADKIRRFPFDPNQIGLEDWLQLGLPPKTAHTILNYRHRGGRFRTGTDLARIYGIPPDLAQELIPWVRISPPGLITVNRSALPDSSRVFHRKRAAPEAVKISVNTADSAGWMALRGIGQKLAGRIVNFREKLGGFYSLQQVGEVYGLQDSVFQLIRPDLVLDSMPLRQLAINTASLEALAAHPYIRFAIARAIVAYRQEHGAFRSLEELASIHLITPGQLEKIRPYCKLN